MPPSIPPVKVKGSEYLKDKKYLKYVHGKGVLIYLFNSPQGRVAFDCTVSHKSLYVPVVQIVKLYILYKNQHGDTFSEKPYSHNDES